MSEYEHPETPRDRTSEAPPTPRLQTLNFGALSALGGVAPAEGLVCDIDDPDCVAPSALAPAEDDEGAAAD
ncbi:MAG: hypothetical protein M0R75_06540 [Dehalococcoidia bacterium]|jgi:hypothetical protein|nr:hypothetical protein [Dehalococcoidia bacterium]